MGVRATPELEILHSFPIKADSLVAQDPDIAFDGGNFMVCLVDLLIFNVSQKVVNSRYGYQISVMLLNRIWHLVMNHISLCGKNYHFNMMTMFMVKLFQ